MTRPSRARRRGLFVTLEGIEGSGKSTQAARLAAELARLGLPVLATREPGGTPLGERVRAAVLDPAVHVVPRAELLLMMAARVQHLEETIGPALDRGALVLCDRYLDASRAYQGAGRGLGVALVDALARRLRLPAPDRTYLLDLPPERAAGRVAARGAADRIERAGLAFQRRVRRAYRARAAAEPRRFVRIDARGDEDGVFSRLLADLLRFAKGRGLA